MDLFVRFEKDPWDAAFCPEITDMDAAEHLSARGDSVRPQDNGVDAGGNLFIPVEFYTMAGKEAYYGQEK